MLEETVYNQNRCGRKLQAVYSMPLVNIMQLMNNVHRKISLTQLPSKLHAAQATTKLKNRQAFFCDLAFTIVKSANKHAVVFSLVPYLLTKRKDKQSFML